MSIFQLEICAKPLDVSVTRAWIVF